jgi:negative regulator of sigma-B (phosphoserine phosphatase)
MAETIGNQASDWPTLIACEVAQRCKSGETIPGDAFLIKPHAQGVLVAVVDGLGHGEQASIAAQLAVSTIERHIQESVVGLMIRCHNELKRTRGAAMSMAFLSAVEATVTWVGVGNVHGVIRRAGTASGHSLEWLLLRSGVIGGQLPALRADVLPMAEGDMLILVTDGIRIEFTEGLKAIGPPRQVADQILEHYGKSSDDALVLVAQFLGKR